MQFQAFLTCLLFFVDFSTSTKVVNTSKVEECRDDHEGCPCLPKCCPKGQVLSSNGEFHGIDCISANWEDLEVKMIGKFKQKRTPVFYGGVLPSCKGLSNFDWKYETHKNFSVDADTREKYILEIPNNGQRIISDFENNAGRNIEKVEGRPFPQPLMHFCFDILGQDTVAVTCPKEEWSKLSPIPKCCPKDQVIFEETCVNKNQNDPEWTVSLDGYLYNASYLIEQGKMKFDQSKSDIFSGQKCSSDKKFPADAFHIGQDGKLHSTEIHPELDALDYFCIDFEREQYDEDDEYDEEEEEAECHIDKNSDLVKLHYCNSAKIIDIPKCCGLGENLNLKGGRCTKQWALEKFKLPQHFTNSVISRFRYTSIWKMNKSRNLVSTNSSFELDWKTGELIYQNKRYPKEKFCVDYSNDYCEGKFKPEWSAVIDDVDLKGSGSLSIFGNSDNDSFSVTIFKRFGYATSLVFLSINLAVHFLSKNFKGIPLRKELSGKLVISLSLSMGGMLLCLYLTTHQTGLENDSSCTALALFTYFFTLTSFGWMSVMSYNIMSQFRGHRKPSSDDNQRLGIYSLTSVGLPALMTLLVFCLQISSKFDPTDLEYHDWRPGFAEVTCWFTPCSNGLVYFFYIPVGVSLMANLVMFCVTANILRNLQKNQSNAFKMRQQTTKGNGIKQAQIERFYTYAKIFGAMGITWIGEIISAYCNVDWLFFILNLPNIFQGVFVFLIFGLKKTHFRKSQRQLQRGRSSRETSSTGTSGNSVNRHPEGLREGRSVSFLPNPEIVTFDLNRKIPK